MALVKAVTVVADLHGVTPGEGEEGGGGDLGDCWMVRNAVRGS